MSLLPEASLLLLQTDDAVPASSGACGAAWVSMAPSMDCAVVELSAFQPPYGCR